MPKEIHVVFHNGSTYNYHFIIKELAEEVKGQFECLGENTERYKTFSVRIKKGVDNSKSIELSLLIALDLCQVHYQILLIIFLMDFLTMIARTVKSCLDYMMFKDDQLIFRCFESEKSYKRDFSIELIERFKNIYEFCREDINKIILLLRKGVYPYEYMDNWERSDETLLPDKEAFIVP